MLGIGSGINVLMLAVEIHKGMVSGGTLGRRLDFVDTSHGV